MEVTTDGLSDYLEILNPLIGDLRTGRTARGIIEGTIAAESLRMNQIALFPPQFKGKEGAYKRVRRLVAGETGKRSELTEAALCTALQAAAAGRS